MLKVLVLVKGIIHQNLHVPPKFLKIIISFSIVLIQIPDLASEFLEFLVSLKVVSLISLGSGTF
jgi:hypothetical protein